MILKTILKKKKIIIISGDEKSEVVRFVGYLLKRDFSIYHINRLPCWSDFLAIMRNDVLVVEDDREEEVKKIKDFFYNHECIFILTCSKKKKRVRDYLSGFPEKWDAVIDFSIAKKLHKRRGRNALTFGVDKKSADFYITDIHKREESVNFKINYKGNIIPFWMDKPLTKREVYSVLAVLCLAEIMDLNLAKVSCKIREEFLVN